MKKTIKVVSFVLALVIIVIALVSCANNTLKGTYSYKGTYGSITYVFNDNKNVSLYSGFTSYKGTYKLETDPDGSRYITFNFPDGPQNINGKFPFYERNTDGTKGISFGTYTYTLVE